MALRELHSQCLKIKYKNKFCSKANFFILLTKVISIIVPLLTVYYNDEIWSKTIVVNKQPSVKFQGYYHFQASTSNSSHPIFCSNFPFLTKYDKDSWDTCSYIKAKEVDVDDDGQIDLFEFTTHVLLEELKINSVLLILSFNYELQGTCTVNMDSIITIEHPIIENAYEVNAYGILQFSQLVVVHCSRFLKTIAEPSIITSPKQLPFYKPQDLLEYHTVKNCKQMHHTRDPAVRDNVTSMPTDCDCYFGPMHY
ncbi:transmembrane protein 231-like [Agrilus planipennis]|uniref:Transmembrane protein 231 n=1 Tax=Agrilus planipennis TaxID=224129 RepID=A0A1W4WQW4_AGRPL|nr:transmembrane protein 231-like [Agrilus planipennis]XP_025831906.1 transmembrane protein 231-like [Agrilus planipennis]